VFESKPVPSSSQVSTYAHFDAFTEDDDLVYPVPNSEPVLLSLFPEFNTRPFLFEGFVSRAPATILIDSGASTSFVSLHWCKQHHLKPMPVYLSHGR
jgi:hypothetical protein